MNAISDGDRYANFDSRASARPRMDGGLALDHARAFLDADQAETAGPACPGHVEAFAVVSHSQHHLSVIP